MSTLSDHPRHGGAENPSLKITDLASPSTPTVIGPPASTGKAPKLRDLDSLFGPLRIGEFSITRAEIKRLGGRLNGEAITASNTYFSDPDQTFIDALHFDPVQVEQRIRSTDGTHRLVGQFLYEIVTQRSPHAAPLMREMPADAQGTSMQKVVRLLDATQRLDIHKNSLSDNVPGWVDKAKSRGMTSMGAGLQAFGLYSAYIGALDALKQGQVGEALINVGGGLAEITSLGFEYALTRTGEKMLRQGTLTLDQFSRTSMGKSLCRSAGLIASVLTLPFDIYTAVKSFNDAAKAEGKRAQDLYVNGGLSVFSAALSLALGCAALAGFQAAGPIGIAAAAIMIVGARVYGAARMVDDIDDYLELSVNQRWRAGWFAFTGQDQDKELMDRFTVAKTYSDYANALKSKSIQWLDNELKDSVEAVVNGRFEVKLQPVRVHKYQWDEATGEASFSTVNTASVLETDDHYDARNGLPSTNDHIVSRPGKNTRGVLWKLGGGNDSVVGVLLQPNYFHYGAGHKRLYGGDQEDTFVFQTAAAALMAPPAKVSYLDGGDGNDLLWMDGKFSSEDHARQPPRYIGYDIDLKNARLGLRSANDSHEPELHSTLDAFENVETLAGASNRVTGSDQNNRIAANGNDRVIAGAGDDQIFVRGSHAIVDGGSGVDTYHIDRMSLLVSITEDHREPSKVYLGVPLEAIQRWCLRGNALVVETLRDDDPQMPRRTLFLEHVYQTVDGKCTLQNDKWMFITQDGYHLQPDWPAETADLTDQTLKAIVIVQGVQKTSPFLLLGPPQTAAADQHSLYFVSRDCPHTTLQVDEKSEDSRSTVYIDFDSTEIDDVRATYSVEVTRQGAYRVLSYKQTHFTLTFAGGARLLSLQGGVSEKPGNKSDMGSAILASPWRIIHPFTLVMRDGVSYHLEPPRNHYFKDVDKPGRSVIQSRESLRERAGRYIFVKPSEEKRTLKTTPQRIELPPGPHRSIYSLEGRSAYYELFPTSNSVVRVSTASTDISTTGSSTWRIHASALLETIERQHLYIADNLLRVGSVHIHLPDSHDPALPLETVDVVVSAGHRYRINSLFEVITLYAIDALACATVEDAVALISEHKIRQELDSNQVPVHNISLANGRPGNIVFSVLTDQWYIDSDFSIPLDPKQLIIKKQTSDHPQ